MTSATASPVPLLDLEAQYRPLRDEILAAMTRVCDSQRFIMGPEVEALERELAACLEVGDAIAVSSGTDALLAVLMALGIGPGDEVITSTYSFFATAGCIARLGATPVLVDIDPVTFNLDPGGRARGDHAADARHHPGAPLRAVRRHGSDSGRARRQAGVPVIEDAARRSARPTTGGRPASMGIAGCFSFFPSKNLGAFGDGGLVTTNDAALAHEIRLLRNHGAEPKYFHKRIGGNFRLDALQAAVLRVKLPHLARWTAHAPRQRRALRRAVRGRRPRGPDRASGRARRPASHLQPVRRPRAGSRSRSRAPDRATASAPRSTTRCRSTCRSASRRSATRAATFPHAEAAADSTLALPIYGELTRRAAGGGRRRLEPTPLGGVMRVLVTGARGLLGAAIVREFHAVRGGPRVRRAQDLDVTDEAAVDARGRARCTRTSSSTAPPTTTSTAPSRSRMRRCA